MKTITLSDGESIKVDLSGPEEITMEVRDGDGDSMTVTLTPKKTSELIGALVGLAAADFVGDFVRKLKGES